MTRRLLVCALALVLAPAIASAQVAAQLHQGMRIRVTTNHGQRIVGNYAGTDSGWVTVVQDGVQNLRTTIARSDVSKLEMSSGRNRGQGALRKALIGLGVGAISGALIGAASYSRRSARTCTPQPGDYFGLGCAVDICFLICSRSQSAEFVGALGGAAGFLFGGFYGLATGHESWVDVGEHTGR